MIEQIKALRNSVPVSLSVAKAILTETPSLPDAISKAQSVYTFPVTKATGVSIDDALDALKSTRGDIAGAIELIGWKTGFSEKEKANRPTRAETRKKFEGCTLIWDLLETAGADGDMSEDLTGIPEEIVHLIAINTFHNIYLTDDQLLYDEYAAVQDRIIEAMRAVGLSDTAQRFEAEIAEGKSSDSSSTHYFKSERAVFRAIKKYCEANLGVIHDWINRGSANEITDEDS